MIEDFITLDFVNFITIFKFKKIKGHNLTVFWPFIQKKNIKTLLKNYICYISR